MHVRMNDFAIMHIPNKCQTMPHLWRLYGDYILHTICKSISWPWLEGKWFLLQLWMKHEAHMIANQLCDNCHYHNLHAWVSKSLRTLWPNFVYLVFSFLEGFLHMMHMHETHTNTIQRFQLHQLPSSKCSIKPYLLSLELYTFLTQASTQYYLAYMNWPFILSYVVFQSFLVSYNEHNGMTNLQ